MNQHSAYLAALGLFVLGSSSYFLYEKYKDRPASKAKAKIYPLELTRKLVQEIKHQLLVECSGFVVILEPFFAQYKGNLGPHE